MKSLELKSLFGKMKDYNYSDYVKSYTQGICRGGYDTLTGYFKGFVKKMLKTRE